MSEFVAERRLVGIDRDGNEFPICIRVGKPYKATAVDWACSVEAKGLKNHLADIHGIDSFQATVLAFNLLQNLLKAFEATGGKILGVDREGEINVLQLFKTGI